MIKLSKQVPTKPGLYLHRGDMYGALALVEVVLEYDKTLVDATDGYDITKASGTWSAKLTVTDDSVTDADTTK